MTIFGAILPQNELKMPDFPLKVLIVLKYGTFVAQNMAHNNLESAYFNPAYTNNLALRTKQ